MKILAIDFNSLMNRSFFAIRTLTAKDGTPTNALYGFVKTYLKLVKTFEPDVVIAAYDVHAPTFRHQMYGDYKGTPFADGGRAAGPDAAGPGVCHPRRRHRHRHRGLGGG